MRKRERQKQGGEFHGEVDVNEEVAVLHANPTTA
jgi:hypothetical protein